jgi:phosphate uptake regulator
MYLWKGQRSLRRMLHNFEEMLEMDKRLFLLVLDALKGRVDPLSVHSDVYKRDIEINRRERAIRKDVVEHMTLHPKGDVPASLVLMSVVKDAERLGDHGKNLLEAAQLMTKPLNEFQYGAEILEIADRVIRVFDKTIIAFKESNTELATEVVREESAMTKRCDALITRVAKSDLSANEAVCTAMLARFLKRCEAHLSNIASSVVLPLHKMDGRLEYKKKTPKNTPPKKPPKKPRPNLKTNSKS